MTVLRLGDGTEFPVNRAEIEREFLKQTIARVFISRDRINIGSFQRGQTEAWLLRDSGDSNANAAMAGIIRNRNTSEEFTELIVESFERYARDAEPTAPGERWENVSDSTVVGDAVDSIPQLSAGTIETTTGNISIMFNHTSQAKKIRDVQEITGGEVRFTPEKDVVYKSRIGSDRGTELSPDNQNVKGEIVVDRKGADEQVTHVRALGAGEGESQIQVEVSVDRQVPRQQWAVVGNPDINRESALRDFANTIIDDFNDPDPVEVETTVRDVEPSLGDRFPVFYPEQDIDRDMRVVRQVEKLTPVGREDKVMLSTRRESRRDQATEERKNIDRYVQTLQGNSTTINTTGGRQPVAPGQNYELEFYYPAEVRHESRMNVRVIGFPYRAFSKGAAVSGGDVAQTDPISNSFDGDTTVTFNLPTFQNATESELATVYLTLGYTPNAADKLGDVTDSGLIDLTITNTTKSETLYQTGNVSESFFVTDTESYIVGQNADSGSSIAGDEIEIDAVVQQEDADKTVWTYDYGAILEAGHVHEPDPGIIEKFGPNDNKTYPANCDVIANPDTNSELLGEISGGSTFRESFDAKGVFTPGAVNRVEVSSTSNGHLMVYIDADVYRQIDGDG